VNDAAEDLRSLQTHRFWFCYRLRGDAQTLRCPLMEGTVRTMCVVVKEILRQDLLEMAAIEDEKPVQALSPRGANEAFRDRVRTGGLDRDLKEPSVIP
jgi:hypothetical protein